MSWTIERIPDCQFVFRRIRDRDVENNSIRSSSLDDSDSELSVDWCKYNGCAYYNYKMGGKADCYLQQNVWRPTYERRPRCAFIAEVMRKYKVLPKDLIVRFFPEDKNDSKKIIIRSKSVNKINQDPSLTSQQRESLLDIYNSSLKFKVAVAQVGQIKEIFPVCHQPTSRREHAIINQHAFEKYSMQREDVLTALAGKFKIIPFSNGY